MAKMDIANPEQKAGRVIILFVIENMAIHSSFIWLVVWNMNFMFPYIGNFIIPTDELIFFRGVGSTTNQL